jgi:glycogen synthase
MTAMTPAGLLTIASLVASIGSEALWGARGDRAARASPERGTARLSSPAMPPRVPKVLHLLRFDDRGGTEVQVATLLVNSRDTGTEQSAALLAPPGPVRRALVEAGVEAHSLAGSFGLVGSIARLVAILRRGRFDLVQAYGFRAGIVARVAALLGGRPGIVIGIRGMHFAGSENLESRMTRFVIAAERALARSVRCYESNSYGAVAFLVSRGLPAAKFRVIPNGVETNGVPRAAHTATTRPRLICVARIVRRKRHAILLQALARLRAEGVDFACDFVGDGPWLDLVRDYAAQLGLADHVAFRGSQPTESVRESLAGSDVFVLPSMWEGLPGSVLEAMAAGLPVVGTDVNGTREVVVDGETGLLVPPDDVDALTDALRTLFADASLRRAMGRRGRERAEREYSIAALVERKAQLLRELTGG